MNDDIDRDAELIGINPDIWRKYRGMTDPKYVQDDLPYFQQQDEKEAKKRHLESIRNRWFGYYRKCKGDRNAIIDQYNRIALMGKER